MTAVMTNEEYQGLTRSQKVKKVLLKVLPLLLLSVTKLYTGLPACVESDGMERDEKEYWKCLDVGPILQH